MLQEREEAAAAEQLLQLQAISPVDLEPWALSSFSSLRLPLAVDDDQQMQYHKKQIHAQPSEQLRLLFSLHHCLLLLLVLLLGHLHVQDSQALLNHSRLAHKPAQA